MLHAGGTDEKQNDEWVNVHSPACTQSRSQSDQGLQQNSQSDLSEPNAYTKLQLSQQICYFQNGRSFGAKIYSPSVDQIHLLSEQTYFSLIRQIMDGGTFFVKPQKTIQKEAVDPLSSPSLNLKVSLIFFNCLQIEKNYEFVTKNIQSHFGIPASRLYMVSQEVPMIKSSKWRESLFLKQLQNDRGQSQNGKRNKKLAWTPQFDERGQFIGKDKLNGSVSRLSILLSSSSQLLIFPPSKIKKSLLLFAERQTHQKDKSTAEKDTKGQHLVKTTNPKLFIFQDASYFNSLDDKKQCTKQKHVTKYSN